MNQIKFLFVLALLVGFVSGVFGEETKESMQKAKEIIEKKEFMKQSGLNELKELSSSLSESEKNALYLENRKIPALGLLSLLLATG